MNKQMKKAILVLAMAGALYATGMTNGEAATPSTIQFEAMNDGNYINWKHKTKVEGMTLHDKNGKEIRCKEKFRVDIAHPLTEQEAKNMAAKTGNKEIVQAKVMILPTLILINENNQLTAIPMGSTFYKVLQDGRMDPIEGFYRIQNPKPSLELSKAVSPFYYKKNF